MQQMGEGHGWSERPRAISQGIIPKPQYMQMVRMGVCHLTYGGVPGLTEFITANMLDRLIWMITQIPALEHSPNIDDKLIQAWF